MASHTPDNVIVNRFEICHAMMHRDTISVYGRIAGMWKIVSGRVNMVALEDGSGYRLLVNMSLDNNDTVMVYVESH